MIEIDSPAIPGMANYWYSNSGQARKAALRYAASLGPGYTIIPHHAHAPGQLPHYHIVTPAGRHLRLHFFFGRKPPIKAPRSWARPRRRWRETEDEEEWSALGELAYELDGEGVRPRIEDRTNLPGTRRTRAQKSSGNRPRSQVYALVLHQMACCRQRHEGGYDSIGVHYAILPDGRILQLQPIEANMQASNGFNSHSVAVEFAGNFPNTQGRCWQPRCQRPPCPNHGCHQLTQAQIDAGRYLVQHLLREPGIKLTHILAHRQSSDTRANDPGPDIWYHVGQWAIDKYGLKDGGPGFKVGTGQHIPQEWRDWGRRARLEPASGSEAQKVRQAIARGQRDVNLLTNMVFFARHPERGGRKLVKSEPRFKQLANEWLAIRDGQVRPALRAAGG